MVSAHQAQLLGYMWGCGVFPASSRLDAFNSNSKGRRPTTESLLSFPAAPGFSLEVSHSSTQLLWPYLTYKATVQGREAAKTHTHTHIAHTLSLCPESIAEMNKSLLFTDKFYLDINPQIWGKTSGSATTQNIYKQILIQLSLIIMTEDEKMGRCYYVLTGQLGSFPNFLTVYKNLFPQGSQGWFHFLIKPP